MTPEQRMHIAMTAKMDGSRAIAETLGRKVRVSEMELLVLANMAKSGLLTVFAGLDAPIGPSAEAERELLCDAIRRDFGKPGRNEGLSILSHACAAILDGEKVGKFIPEV